MSLPITQHRVLAYLAEYSPSGTGDIAKALAAMYPISFEITEQGRKELEAEQS